MSSVTQTVKGSALDVLRQIRRQVENGKSYVKVGVMGQDSKKSKTRQADESNKRGPTNVELAIWHEYGTRTAPERSFLRSTMKRNAVAYATFLGANIHLVIQKKRKLEQLLNALGAKAAADVKNTIRQGIPPPNSPETIRRKGSSKPLIDTGQLVNSITWIVQTVKGTVKL